MEDYELSFNMQADIDFLGAQEIDSDQTNKKIIYEIMENPDFDKLMKNLMNNPDNSSLSSISNNYEYNNTLGSFKPSLIGGDEDETILGNVVDPNEIFMKIEQEDTNESNLFDSRWEDIKSESLTSSNEPSRDMSLDMSDLRLTKHSDELATIDKSGLYSSYRCMSQDTSSFSKRERQKKAKTSASQGFSHDHPYTQDITSSDQMNGRLDQTGTIFPSYESMSGDNSCDPLQQYNEQFQCDYPNAHSSSSSRLNNCNYESSNISHIPEESAVDFNDSQYAPLPYDVKLEIESPNSYGSPTNSYASSPAPQTPFYSHYDSDATASVPSPNDSFDSSVSVRGQAEPKVTRVRLTSNSSSVKLRAQRMSLAGLDTVEKHRRIRDQNNRASREYRERRKERDSELINDINVQESLKLKQELEINNMEKKKLILRKLIQMYRE